jgi:hypothetical protein
MIGLLGDTLISVLDPKPFKALIGKLGCELYFYSSSSEESVSKLLVSGEL